MHVWVYVHMMSIYLCLYSKEGIFMHTCIYAHTCYLDVYICSHVNTYLCTHVYTYIVYWWNLLICVYGIYDMYEHALINLLYMYVCMCVSSQVNFVLYVYVHAHVHLCLFIANRYVHMPMLPLYTWHTCENIFACSWWKCLPLWPSCPLLVLTIRHGQQPGDKHSSGPTFPCKILAKSQKWICGGPSLVSFPVSER